MKIGLKSLSLYSTTKQNNTMRWMKNGKLMSNFRNHREKKSWKIKNKPKKWNRIEYKRVLKDRIDLVFFGWRSLVVYDFCWLFVLCKYCYTIIHKLCFNCGIMGFLAQRFIFKYYNFALGIFTEIFCNYNFVIFSIWGAFIGNWSWISGRHLWGSREIALIGILRTKLTLDIRQLPWFAC